MNLELPRIAGHFTMTVHGGRRGRMVLAEFDNLITDSGLNDIFASTTGSGATRCQLGTGTAAPTAADNALSVPGPVTTTIQRAWSTSPTYTAGPPDYTSDYTTMRFNTGVATGTWTEVAMTRNSPTTFFSRALILNGVGAPVPISVLADETLDVTYTLRVYPPTADVTGSISLGGSSYDYIIRPSQVNSAQWGPNRVASFAGYAGRTVSAGSGPSVVWYDGAISARTSTPSGTSAGAQLKQTASAYSNNSMQRTTELEFGLSDGNIAGGIKSILFNLQSTSGNSGLQYQMEFTPKVPKDNTKVLRLSFTSSFARRP